MRVEVNLPESVTEPRIWVRHGHVIGLVLRSGSTELGATRSEMRKLAYTAGEMFLCPRHSEKWIGASDLHYLSITISDAALSAAFGSTSGDTELREQLKLADARLSALVAAVNAERIAGFPSGQLFLDSLEQALAMALLSGYAARRPAPRIYRGGLSPARLRRVTDLVRAKIDNDLTLEDLAQSADLSVAHFSQMFRRSTGESPHQFVLRRRVERAKEMLRAAEARVLDVAVACGFKTQQHFARVFRQLSGTSPTKYRQQLLD
jgi:AraC family transcriptional regulator